jgi:hypothetical protein
MRFGRLLAIASALAAARPEPKSKRSTVPVAVSVVFAILAIAAALYLAYFAYDWLRIYWGAPLAALATGIGSLLLAGAVFFLTKPRTQPERRPLDGSVFGPAVRNVDRIAREHPYAMAASLFAIGVLQGISDAAERRRDPRP